MKHSALLIAIKKYYGRQYTKEMVRNFVEKGLITEEEYKEITGEDY